MKRRMSVVIACWLGCRELAGWLAGCGVSVPPSSRLALFGSVGCSRIVDPRRCYAQLPQCWELLRLID